MRRDVLDSEASELDERTRSSSRELTRGSTAIREMSFGSETRFTNCERDDLMMTASNRIVKTRNSISRALNRRRLVAGASRTVLTTNSRRRGKNEVVELAGLATSGARN